MRNPAQGYTFQSHSACHGVTHETARNDILPLVERGFVSRERVGPRYVFTAPADLADLLKAVT